MLLITLYEGSTNVNDIPHDQFITWSWNIWGKIFPMAKNYLEISVAYLKWLKTSAKPGMVESILRTHVFLLCQSPRSMSLDEVEEDMLHDAWSPEKSVLHNGMLSPVTARDTTGFLDDSQDNQYSIEIETLLVGNKLNGGLSPQDAFPAPSQLLVQLCKVTQITPSIMVCILILTEEKLICIYCKRAAYLDLIMLLWHDLECL